MPQMRRLIVIGAGGFGQEIVWAARNSNSKNPSYEIIGYCDDDRDKIGKNIYGCKVLGMIEDINRNFSESPGFVCAIGNNRQRATVVHRALALGWIPVTVIDPSVIVADGVVIGDGTYVGAGSILSPYSHIGNHVIINHHCSIGHDSTLEDYVQVSPGGRVSGSSTLKEGALLSSNAVLGPGKKIGRYSVLGACSFAMTDIPDQVTSIGIPARVAMHHV